MKRYLRYLFPLLILFFLAGLPTAGKAYEYLTVPGDPLQARIYTLDNGLKVYMSVYRDEPRIQTYIVVKAGSRNDPPDATGLAHYFEHMLFKGTGKIGTIDWEKEKILIDRIESFFEAYRAETDPDMRAAIYREIDALSYEASHLAIPNEYDKLMRFIGSRGTNAATSYDYTLYIENIPANQLENWADIQAERFADPVLRQFHTELETVYEEKNMSLTNDGRKVWEAMQKALYPHHPYGRQTVLGDPEHLKNPSMRHIRKFYDTYYVPNNMAVILAGDFDPDRAIAVIDRAFGTMASREIPPLQVAPESPLTEPVTVEVTGLEAEQVSIGFRFPGASSREAMRAEMLARMLSNGSTGLIDLDVNLKQRALSAGAYCYKLADYSSLILSARNRSGQSLEEVRDILLEQVARLRKGDFPAWMLEATVNNMKLAEMKRLESNRGRASMMSGSFVNGIAWPDAVAYLDELGEMSREELVAFARETLGEKYAVVFKRTGDPKVEMVPKPPITPIHINRDEESSYLAQFRQRRVTDIDPVFVDYETDLNRFDLNGIEVLHKQNEENATFSLYYYFPFGSDQDRLLRLAAGYLNYLGTSTMKAEELAQAFYRLACSFDIHSEREETYVVVTGLSENQEEAAALMETILADARPDEQALAKYIDRIIKERENARLDQQAVFSGLINYATYGPRSPFTHIVPNAELAQIQADTLIARIRDLPGYRHKILYYGPLAPYNLKAMLMRIRKVPAGLKEMPGERVFDELPTDSNRVFFSHYEANQSYLQLITRGEDYSFAVLPPARMYNVYFSGGMNAVVFQELREKRGLAYAAYSVYGAPSRPDGPFMNNAFIATQNDKVIEAFNAFNELFDDMPVSQAAFDIARDAILNGIRNERITKMNIIWNYLNARRMGYREDLRKTYFETIPAMTLDDVVRFNQAHLKNKPRTYVILGNEKILDFKQIEEKFGPVTEVSRDLIFAH